MPVVCVPVVHCFLSATAVPFHKPTRKLLVPCRGARALNSTGNDIFLHNQGSLDGTAVAYHDASVALPVAPFPFPRHGPTHGASDLQHWAQLPAGRGVPNLKSESKQDSDSMPALLYPRDRELRIATIKACHRVAVRTEKETLQVYSPEVFAALHLAGFPPVFVAANGEVILSTIHAFNEVSVQLTA